MRCDMYASYTEEKRCHADARYVVNIHHNDGTSTERHLCGTDMGQLADAAHAGYIDYTMIFDLEMEDDALDYAETESDRAAWRAQDA